MSTISRNNHIYKDFLEKKGVISKYEYDDKDIDFINKDLIDSGILSEKGLLKLWAEYLGLNTYEYSNDVGFDIFDSMFYISEPISRLYNIICIKNEFNNLTFVLNDIDFIENDIYKYLSLRKKDSQKINILLTDIDTIKLLLKKYQENIRRKYNNGLKDVDIATFFEHARNMHADIITFHENTVVYKIAGVDYDSYMLPKKTVDLICDFVKEKEFFNIKDDKFYVENIKLNNKHYFIIKELDKNFKLLEELSENKRLIDEIYRKINLGFGFLEINDNTLFFSCLDLLNFKYNEIIVFTNKYLNSIDKKFEQLVLQNKDDVLQLLRLKSSKEIYQVIVLTGIQLDENIKQYIDFLTKLNYLIVINQ